MTDVPEFIPGRSPLGELPSGAASLVEAGKALLITGGFDALRIAKITAAAGQNRAMVNYYFGSKAAMVAVVVDSLIHEALEELSVKLDGLPEGDTRVGALVDSTVDLMQTPEFLATLDVIPSALRDEDLRARLATLYTWYRDMVSTCLGPEAAGVEEGQVRLLAALFVALFDGLAIQWALDAESVDLDALAPLIKDMVASATERGSEARLLLERVKELNCLYGISRLFERDGERLDDTLQAVVELLPPAWQHADVATARIELNLSRYATPGFRETPWIQTCPVIVLGEPTGRVTVAYMEERPESDEGPFLAEERSLLNAVSQRLGSYVEREQARQQLAVHQDKLRSLAAQLAVSEQQERRRVAELLHDRIGQTLALLSIKLAQTRGSTDDPAVKEMLSETQGLVGDLISETRFLTFELCPPILYELGLHQAVEWLGEEFQNGCGLEVQIEQHGDPGRLSDDLRTTLFQAVRELLTNVAKHAGARTARVTLSGSGDTVIVAVADDGKGMDTSELAAGLTEHHGFGLFNIRERLNYLGGTMQVSSQVGHGTTVTLEVPCDA